MTTNKLHSIEISRNKWKGLVWTLIVLGALLMVVSYTVLITMTISNLLVRGILFMGFAGGSILLGGGFGLAYARIFEIEGIDT